MGRSPKPWLFYLSMLANEIKEIYYWNENARWYKLWRKHNTYHKPIKIILSNLLPQGIKVLDIGAGDGVLSFHLMKTGCNVVALEPSDSMQKYIYENSLKYGINIKIDARRFEDLAYFELQDFQLALACNSLHLTEYGLEGSLFKLFNSQIEGVFLVTEKNLDYRSINFIYPEYSLIFKYSYICESSFVYHNLKEVFEHWEWRHRRELLYWEREELLKSIYYKGEHFYLKDYAVVKIFYWRRIR